MKALVLAAAVGLTPGFQSTTTYDFNFTRDQVEEALVDYLAKKGQPRPPGQMRTVCASYSVGWRTPESEDAKAPFCTLWFRTTKDKS